MKKTISVILAFCMLFSICAFSASACDTCESSADSIAYRGEGVIEGFDIRLRSCSDENSSVKCELQDGDGVRITRADMSADDGRWYYCTVTSVGRYNSNNSYIIGWSGWVAAANVTYVSSEISLDSAN